MKSPNWTGKEIAILRARYAAEGALLVAELTGRTPSAVRNTAYRLGLQGAKRGRRRYEGKIVRAKHVSKYLAIAQAHQPTIFRGVSHGI